ncbi:hypothetical protein J6590_105756 [Homalodisca vitripennis]|nr:hypothetical protein J6590_105756 [Homalodisca vitripennis]
MSSSANEIVEAIQTNPRNEAEIAGEAVAVSVSPVSQSPEVQSVPEQVAGDRHVAMLHGQF